MRIPSLLFLLIISNGILSAQDNDKLLQQKIDSIQKQLDTNHAEDTNTVKSLNDLARVCFLNYQYEKGFEATYKARALADKIQYKKGNALYLRTMSAFYSYNDRFLFRYYNRKARWAYDSLNEKENISGLELSENNAAFTEKTTRRLFDAFAHVEKQGKKEAAVHLLYGISNSYFDSGKSDSSDWSIDKSIKLSRELKMDDLTVFGLAFKMYMLNVAGKTKEANEADSAANQIISATPDTRQSALLTWHMGIYYFYSGKVPVIIERELKSENALERVGDKEMRILALEDIAVSFAFMNMGQKSVEYYKKAIVIRDQLNYYEDAIRIYFNLGFELVALKEFDDAKIYFSKARELINKESNPQMKQGLLLRYADAMGQILMGEGKYQEALAIFNQGADNFYVNYYKANCYHKLGDLPKSVSYGEKSYEPALSYGNDQRLLIKICILLAEVYEESKQPMKAYKYLKEYRNLIKKKEEEDIANHSANLEIQSIIEKSQREKDTLKQEKLLKEKQNQNQRWWLISITGALLSAFALLFVLYRNNQHKQKANSLLQKQKKEIQDTLSQLKSTQSQLIQSEKMASLGQLTAGIAHEIQNPLNFVNNFSDVNKEMLEELKAERLKPSGERDEQTESGIINDVLANEEKINHHGKRADAIVKGMLQHSRTTAGVKEPTDINALADEYLRLAYHGIRGKDKMFNVTMQTDFDPSIGKINIVPQDIGRVLLNLYNNAFYATNERFKAENFLPHADYKPTVSVHTRKVNGRVEIIVRDNGSGIPQNLIDKIFQPFFTTKPTGVGTGLGLSLSYDIVKAHGGELKIESVENRGAEFKISLPV